MTQFPIVRNDSPMCQRLALHFEGSQWWKVPAPIKGQFQKEVITARQRLPVDVLFTHKEDDPYISTLEMARAIAREGVFRVRFRTQRAHVLGAVHMDFRAIHDWFGHVINCNPFTFEGELAAFEIHRKSGMFSRATLPLVWSEIVLENAYACWYGKFHSTYKPVYDPAWGVH